MNAGQGIAGAPATVAAFLRKQVEDTGSNYVVGQFVFGDISLAEAVQSLELFAREVMPELKARSRSRWDARPMLGA